MRQIDEERQPHLSDLIRNVPTCEVAPLILLSAAARFNSLN